MHSKLLKENSDVRHTSYRSVAGGDPLALVKVTNDTQLVTNAVSVSEGYRGSRSFECGAGRRVSAGEL